MERSLSEKFSAGATKFSNFRFVKCMSAACTAGMGVTIVGSIFMLLQNPPFAADAQMSFVLAWRAWAQANSAWLGLGYQVTTEFMGLYVLLGMVMANSELKGLRPKNTLILSIPCFLILASGITDGKLNLNFLGSKGMITAMLVGFFVVEATDWLMKHGFKINLPESVPPFVAEPLNAMLVNIIVVGAAVGIRLILGALSGGLLLPQLINNLFAPLFIASDSLIAVIVYTLFVRLLWFLGIHGGSVANAVMTPVVAVTLTANMEAFMANEPLPYIFTSMYISTWTQMGILAMVLALMIVARSQQLKAISRVAVAPAFFGIGEPLTFGLPIVMNFKILVPYLLVFVMNSAVPYIATSMGLLGRAFVNVPYTVPHIFKVFLVSMDFRAVILYLILMVLDILIFIPWIKKYDRELLANEVQA